MFSTVDRDFFSFKRLTAMDSSQTDLTFFTNEAGQCLLDRFKATLKDTQLFDVLVGFFRASGFYQLAESPESTAYLYASRF